MGLTSSLQIGRSALTASQIAIQVTGNNFANAATPGYSRQIATMTPTRDDASGSLFLGRGVQVRDVRRQLDSALQSRLWSGVSNEAAASMDLQLFAAVEASLNELTESDLSSELSRFFNGWSELANTPTSEGTRSLVVQQGRTLSSFMRTLRSSLTDQRGQIDDQLGANIGRADQLVAEVAGLNAAIVEAEGGGSGGAANALRDQRDSLITELSSYLDVTAIEQPSGAVDILVGSTPVVLAGTSRGLQLRRETVGDTVEVSVALRSNDQQLNVSAGRIGSLLGQRDTLVNATVDRLDSLASQLIFEVNRLHSAGYGTAPLTSASGTRPLAAADAARSLNDPQNAGLAGLPFRAVNGGFLVTVADAQSGATQTVRVDVDLDGIEASGQPGYADDTSVASIAAALNAVPNLSASVAPDGTLRVNADAGHTFSFSDDNSGALAVLGVNAYFTGSDASDINVRQALQDQPGLLSTGRSQNGQPSDNGAALAISQLQDRSLQALGGQSVRGAWLGAVQSIAVQTDAAKTRSEAATLVRENLDAQRSAVSGVSIDEESVNLLTYQRQYQGAARFISTVDELTQTLLSLI